jgi:hypothetical protein
MHQLIMFHNALLSFCFDTCCFVMEVGTPVSTPTPTCEVKHEVQPAGCGELGVS